MKRQTRFLLVLALFSLLLLACEAFAAPASPAKEDFGALVFLNTLKSAVTEGEIVRDGLNDDIEGFISGRVTRAALVRKARAVRDWHRDALKEMEVSAGRAPSEYRRLGRLYSDFLRDFAEATDLLADGAESANTVLLDRAIDKLRKSFASRDAFIRELETLYEKIRR